MIFGKVPLDQAAGAVLAHSMQAAGARPYRIAKGTVLEARHLADLAAAGVAQVSVARLEPGDLPEDAAARALAAALVPDGAAQNIRISGAGAGRVNLYAECAGIVRIDAAAVAALNDVDPMITVATVAPFARVGAGGMIATLKIISYAVPQARVDQAGAMARGAIAVLPPVFALASLIETAAEAAPSDKGRQATQTRLAQFGIDLSPRVVVPHCEAPLAAAIAEAPGEMVLILTQSATSDVHDVAPEALRRAGGSVVRFGMPVDPGNLLFLGEIAGKPVIGLPGCARSLALNGADWVLNRVACGLAVTGADIAAMGVGGLLKEIPSRPMPRARRG